MSRRSFGAFFAFSLILNAFCAPVQKLRFKKNVDDNNIDVFGNSDNVPLPISRGDIDDTQTKFGESPSSSTSDLNTDDTQSIFGESPSSSTSNLNTDNTSDQGPFLVESPTSTVSPEEPTKREPIHIPLPEDDDDDDFEPMEPANTTNGGSNLISLLNIATALFPGSNSNNVWIRNVIKYLVNNNFSPNLLNPLSFGLLRRQDVSINEIQLDDSESKSSQTEENDSSSESEDQSTSKTNEKKNKSDNNSDSSSSESEADDSSSESIEDSEERGNKSDEKNKNEDDKNNAAEESVEIKSIEVNKNSKQVSDSNGDNMSNDANGLVSDSDYDSDEPPGGGDGEGGGILGLLAGLSGGEDGQSDLGSLLATVGGIVANLSGDGIDLNSLIASGLGLFVGLLSEGNENPGGVVASYLLTSLDTITGGGANNNGEFFGTFISKLLKGISANAQNANRHEPASPMSAVWTLKLDIIRAFLSFGTSLLGAASSGSSAVAN